MKSIYYGIILASLAAVTGCAALAPPFEKQAFGYDKTYALVSIYADKNITKEGEAATAVGMIKALAGKAAYGQSAEDAFNASASLIGQELASSRHYRLAPAIGVLDHPAYQDVLSDPQGKLSEKRHLAPGYKYLWDNKKLGKLARDLNVDGVITVHVQYRYKHWGTNFGGLTSTGKTSPVIGMTVRFYDRGGQPVWTYADKKYLTEGVPAVGDAADMTALQPLIVRGSELTARAVVASLDKRMQLQ